MNMIPKGGYDDKEARKYLDYLHGQPCFLSGFEGHEHETVDPAHVRHGYLGISKKPPPWTAIPLKHALHVDQHNTGEVRWWRDQLASNDYALMEAVKAVGIVKYLTWCLQTGRSVEDALREIDP